MNSAKEKCWCKNLADWSHGSLCVHIKLLQDELEKQEDDLQWNKEQAKLWANAALYTTFCEPAEREDLLKKVLYRRMTCITSDELKELRKTIEIKAMAVSPRTF